jgi:SagB-type dehydrogenase family enzyme
VALEPWQEQGREWLTDRLRKRVDFSGTPQQRGVEPPPLEKPFDPARPRIALARPGRWKGIGGMSVADAIRRRRSRRAFTDAALTPDELAFLLWATQGVKRVLSPAAALRTVPSAGARHAFETYVLAFRVGDLAPGVYRYLPIEHELLFEFAVEDLPARAAAAAFGQAFAGACAATFAWTCLPQRMEWRYGPCAYKVIALDAGHVCQNLYLACEAIGAGTCAIAAYDQEAMDALLRVDGRDEFTVYLAPVGRPRE